MASDYQDDDDRRAALLAPSISPEDEEGEEQQGQSNPPDGGEVSSTEPPPQETGGMMPAPRSTPAPAQPRAQAQSTPVAVAPSQAKTPGTNDWKSYVDQGLKGQLAGAQGAAATEDQLNAQPDEASALAPIEQRRTATAAAAPDPKAPQYKPGIGTRIVRGIDAFRKGGVLGTVDPASVGGQAYGAPTNQFNVDQAKNKQQLAGEDQELTQARQAFQDATARAKARATGQRATADAYGKVVTGGNLAQGEENKANLNANTAAHNAVTEKETATRDANTKTYQTGELKNRAAEVGVQRARLAWDKSSEDSSDGNSKNDKIRQPLIDDAKAKLDTYKDQWKYSDLSGEGHYVSGDKTITAAEYIDKMNQISADLDKQLATKKVPTLGLRWKAGPNGQEVPVQPGNTAPAPAAAPKDEAKPQKTVTSKQQIKVGDSVMYKGKSDRVVGFNAKGEAQLESNQKKNKS